MKGQSFRAAVQLKQDGVVIGDKAPVSPPLRYIAERPEVYVCQEYLATLNLAPRDIKVLQYVNEMRFAATSQLATLFWNNNNTGVRRRNAARRLRNLWEKHLLNREPGAQLIQYGWRQELVYSLGKAGAMYLTEADAGAKPQAGSLTLAHNVLLGEVVLNLRQRVSARNLEVVVLGESGSFSPFGYQGTYYRLRPDATVILRNPVDQKERSYFVEMETCKRTVKDSVAKLKLYEHLCASRDWIHHYDRFPQVLMVVWGYADDRGAAGDDRRRRMANARIQRMVDAAKSNLDRTTWHFARLDQIEEGHWITCTSDGMSTSNI